MLVHELIAARREEIIARWRADVRAVAAEAKSLARSEIEDNIPGLLDEIVAALEARHSISDASPNASEHGKQRLRVGFDLNTVVREYGILRNCILRCAEDAGVHPTIDEYRRLDDSLTIGISDAVVEYSKVRFRLFEMFVSVLSRDLKNPLQAISTGAEMLQGQAAIAAAAIARVASQMVSSANRINRIVDQLLDLSRVGLGGGFALHRQWFDVKDVCAEVIAALEAAHPGRVVDLNVDGQCTGSWDRERIAQVLSNLGVNALTHGDQTSPVEYQLRADGDAVVIAVHNVGEPIPEAEFARLFDPFRQHPEAPGGSLGLGLYIVREIVREHGGTVTIDSTADAGTTFRVRLPKATV
jgi:signal transduction histidine kinase